MNPDRRSDCRGRDCEPGFKSEKGDRWSGFPRRDWESVGNVLPRHGTDPNWAFRQT